MTRRTPPPIYILNWGLEFPRGRSEIQTDIRCATTPRQHNVTTPLQARHEHGDSSTFGSISFGERHFGADTSYDKWFRQPLYRDVGTFLGFSKVWRRDIWNAIDVISLALVLFTILFSALDHRGE